MTSKEVPIITGGHCKIPHYIINFLMTGFDFYFKTINYEGLILYAASLSQEEVVVLQLLNGRLLFMFDPQCE